MQNRVLQFLTICFVTPSLPNFCQKFIYFQFFDMGLTSPPPIWAMSLNILFFFSDVTPYAVGCAAYAVGCAAYVRQCENKANSVQLSWSWD